MMASSRHHLNTMVAQCGVIATTPQSLTVRGAGAAPVQVDRAS
jgi:hypothetical protein